MNPSTTPSKFPTPTAGGEASTLKAATALDQDPSLVASHLGKDLPQGATKIGVWTRVSSFSFATLLLAAAPSQAAGVCIICPPGHTCPPGEAPVLGGTPGQIMRRTQFGGLEWTNINNILFDDVPHGATGATNLSAAQLRHATCPRPQNTAGGVHVIAHHRCSNVGEADLHFLTGALEGPGRFCWCRLESRANPGCFSSWVPFRGGQGDMSDKGDLATCDLDCRFNCGFAASGWVNHTRW